MSNPLDKEFVDAGHTSAEKAEALGQQERSAFVSSDGETVDIETIRRFVEQLEEQAGLGDEALEAIVAELEKKQETFARLLGDLPDLDPERVEFVLRNVFATRGRREEIIETLGIEGFNEVAHDLLEGDGSVADRVDRFCDRLDGIDERVRWTLAAELLHLSDPERYHLWTRWMWNPESRTGAVPLMTMADVDLEGDSPGEIYELVGAAVERLNDRTAEMGFTPAVVAGPLGTDVAMATVHAVYTYLVLGMRMTKEFTQAIPDHPEYIRRLLGTQELHEQQAATAGGNP